jgi:hypothetical protein
MSDRLGAGVGAGRRDREEGDHREWWLWLSVPIAMLAVGASLSGIFLGSVYAKETENFAAQSVGQDIANLVAYPVLLLMAWAAGRGSVRAYLAWLGVLVFSVYSYAIYSFDVRFNGLFLVYVAVLGLSIYALIGGLAVVDPDRVKAAFGSKAAVRSTWIVLVIVAALFYIQWLSEDVPAILGGKTPQSLLDAGLPTSPVHVLDMAVLLPAVLVTGVLLSKRRAWAFFLAPVLLTALILLALAIVTLMAVLQLRDVSGGSWAIAAVFAVIGLILLAVEFRFSGNLDRNATLGDVLRTPSGARDRSSRADGSTA